MPFCTSAIGGLGSKTAAVCKQKADFLHRRIGLDRTTRITLVTTFNTCCHKKDITDRMPTSNQHFCGDIQGQASMSEPFSPNPGTMIGINPSSSNQFKCSYLHKQHPEKEGVLGDSTRTGLGGIKVPHLTLDWKLI